VRDGLPGSDPGVLFRDVYRPDHNNELRQVREGLHGGNDARLL
jgi:hypothetical protein